MLVTGAVVVGAGALAYKLGKKDTQKVEQHTGKSVEEMTDEELEQAVNELNLRKEPLDENDQAYLAQQEQPAEEAPYYLDELERLGELKEKGLITEEEFQAKKKQLLGL